MNHLKMNVRAAIITLSGKGWSQRRIARELGIDRGSVAKYRHEARAGDQAKPAIVPTGSPETGLEASGEPPDPKPAIVPTGSGPGRQSQCEAYRVEITQSWEAGLTAQRIYQDLVSEKQFKGSYDAVKRFVRQLGSDAQLPFRRIESEPGEQAQVDFGQGAWVIDENGRRRRPHALRVILSFSRKGYTEVFWEQTTENFIRGLENAFRHFGGVPASLVIDNLRAAVTQADWFDPELNPKVLSFAEHYGTVILPTRPAMPRHKGKVEAGVKYVQSNGLAGREFTSLGAQNLFLTNWEQTVADTRIHGTTRQQVRALFLVEKPKLLPLAASLFPAFNEAPRQVHRDGYVEVAKAYYSVPPEYVRRQVWARWDAKLVHVYNQRRQVIAIHVRREPGRFCTDPSHIDDRKRTITERGAKWLLDECRLQGTSVGEWAEQLYANRGAQSLRVLQGLLSLAKRHPGAKLNQACQLALTHGSWRLKELKALLARPTTQEQFGFIQTHPLIRDLHAYQNLVPACFEQTPNLETPPHEISQP
jgi:transposase